MRSRRERARSRTRSRSRSRSESKSLARVRAQNKKSKMKKTQYGLKIPSKAKKYLDFDENGNELWSIENILATRVHKGKNEYLVKWDGWAYRYCTWEPEQNFLEDMSIIEEFVKEKNKGKRKSGYKKYLKEVLTPNNESRSPAPAPARGKGGMGKGSWAWLRKEKSSECTKIRIRRMVVNEPGGKFSIQNRPRRGSKPKEIFYCPDVKKNKKSPKKTLCALSIENSDSDDFEDILSEDNVSVHSQQPFEDREIPTEIVEEEYSKIVVEESIVLLGEREKGIQESMRFKVAFYNLEGIKVKMELLTYQDMKKKGSLEDALLYFYQTEILNHVAAARTDLTENIKAS